MPSVHKLRNPGGRRDVGGPLQRCANTSAGFGQRDSALSRAVRIGSRGMRSRVHLITFVYVCSVNYTSRCNNVRNDERDYVLIVGERAASRLPGSYRG